ncbi:acyltransferase family protein [Demequina pelophila]|uniref:acyltransferase family protein n=1 Tax=Demequina pelophila TaxID=1638984 RepID=UPI0007832C03|nr:acyltransferase family protein [Demequina pelophila]
MLELSPSHPSPAPPRASRRHPSPAPPRASRRHAAPRTPASEPGFRPDIQALRALAVVLVVAFHLWPGAVTGGYVGVDVFFVISGFLITSHLWREAAMTGRIRLGRFWARRARRLLPSALLVLFVSAIATAILAPAASVVSFLHEHLAAALYGENWFLAALSVDYLGAGSAESPVVHYWSLSVEEQFYVLLPLALVAVLAASARARLPRRAAVLGLFAALGVASFLLSVVQTPDTSAAYFSTFTRLWEFVLGGIVAVALTRVRRVRLAVPVGLAAILVAAFAFDASTPFPGHAAALPVLGAALLLAGGADSVLSRAGSWAPVAHLGRTSYAIYLWHWPLVVLVPFATGRELGHGDRVAIVVATVVLAALTTRFVEDPMRFSPRLLAGRSPAMVAAWSLAGMAAVAAAVGVGLVGAHLRAEAEREAAEQIVERAEEIADAAGPSGDDVAGDVAGSPEPVDCLGAGTLLHPDECADAPATHFVPALADLASDDANRAECWSGLASPEFNLCTVGRVDAPVRYLVLGDSHSNVLLAAYDRLAQERGWRFDVAGHAGCYLTTRALEPEGSDRREGCDAWRAAALDAAAGADGYDAVIVTRRLPPNVTGDLVGAEVDGLVEAWASVPAGVPVVVIEDNPRLGSDVADCLAFEGPDGAAACAVERGQALPADPQAQAASRVPAARLVDLSDLFCDATACPAVIGGVVVYRPDGHHVTASYARTFAPVLGDRIAAAAG